MKIYSYVRDGLPAVGDTFQGFRRYEVWHVTGIGYSDTPECPGEACGWYFTVAYSRGVSPDNRADVRPGPMTL